MMQSFLKTFWGSCCRSSSNGMNQSMFDTSNCQSFAKHLQASHGFHCNFLSDSVSWNALLQLIWYVPHKCMYTIFLNNNQSSFLVELYLLGKCLFVVHGNYFGMHLELVPTQNRQQHLQRLFNITVPRIHG